MYTRKYEVGPMVSVRRSRLQGEDLRQRRNGRPRARTIAAGHMNKGAILGLTRSAAEQSNLCFSRERRSEEHTSELQSLMRISYAVFCLKQKTMRQDTNT